MKCKFIPNANGTFVCKYCRDEQPEKIVQQCVFSPVLRTMRFTKEAIAHLLNGSPTCTQQQLDERFAVCQACKWFRGNTCNHQKCGCNVNGAQKYLNKLAWAEQECPDGRWKAIDSKPNSAPSSS